MGIVFDTYGYLIFSLPLPSLLCWVSFSIPMLACNAPLWSGCPSLLPGIVFDTHQPVLVSSPPSHRYRFQYPRLCGGILLLLFYCRVSFSIPINLCWFPPLHHIGIVFNTQDCVESFTLPILSTTGYRFRYPCPKHVNYNRRVSESSLPSFCIKFSMLTIRSAEGRFVPLM